jgi:putative transposase
MKKRFTEEQIIAILNEGENAPSIDELLRKHGVSRTSYYKWKSKFGGMDISEARRLKALEEENRRLKRLVADLSLDNQMLKEVNSKNW